MSDIAFIYFDAGGTLLFPQPGVGDVYAAVGQRFGTRRNAADLTRRFRAAFHRQTALDEDIGWRTDDGRELARWRAIVAEAIDDVDDPQCFETLYDHFGQPDAWTCPPETGDVLHELAVRGYGLGVASNFDQRLYAIVAGKPELQPIQRVQISAQARWSKPAASFFTEAARFAETPPARILFVGDDLRNDYDAPHRAGYTALLLDARGRCVRPDVERITSLADLLRLCPRVR